MSPAPSRRWPPAGVAASAFPLSLFVVSAVSGLLAAPAHAAPLPIDQVLAHAEEHAPSLKVALSALDLARAEAVGADLAVPDNPELELAAGPRLSSEGAALSLEVALSQRVFVDGQRTSRLAAAKQALRVAEAHVEVARWALHAEVHAAFDHAVVARERVTLLAEVEGFQARLAEVATKRVKAGEIARLDALLAGVELAEARQLLVEARAEAEQARLAVARVIGWQGPEPLELGGLPAPPPLPSLDALRARALEREPELGLARALVKLAQARLSAARNDAGVTPAFGVVVEHEGALGLEPAVTSARATFSLPLPLAQKNQGPIATARAELVRAEAEVAARAAHVHGRLAELHVALASARERLTLVAEDILPKVSETLTLLERGYALGEIGLSDAIVARERFVRARLDALTALSHALAARAELEPLLGADLEEVAP